MAPSETVKKIIYELIVEGQSAIKGYAAASTASDEYRNRLEKLASTNIKLANTALKAASLELKQATQATKDTGKASQEAEPKVNSFVDALHSIASAVAAALALNKLISLLQSAGEKFLDYRQSLFALEVGIRALQRSGMDTTIKEWKDSIVDLHEEYKIFSEVALTEAVAQTALMTRNFGFSKDETIKLTQAALTLATVMGKDVQETIHAVTFAISSGYTEGLQRLYANMSTASLEQEALNMGYKEGWNALDPLIRALVAESLILKQTAAFTDDLGEAQKTMAGRFLDATSDVEDATKNLGKSVLPVQTVLTKTWALFLEELSKAATQILKIYIVLSAAQASFAAGITTTLAYITSKLLGSTMSWEEFGEKLRDSMNRAHDETYAHLSDQLGLLDDSMDDAAVGIKDTADAAKQELAEMEAALSEFEQDVQKLHDDAARDREDAQRDHLRRLSDLDINYFRDLEDINSDFDNRRMERISRGQEDEYGAEAKFQERMRTLREKYLYDLEDAVRVRDARKVLDLNRQYNLQREQRRREFEEERVDRARQLEYDLKMLERERQMRLRDRALRLAQDRADADLRLRRELEDIDRIEQYKLKALLEAFAEEQRLNAENSQKVYDILAKYYGPGGAIEGLYKYYVGMVRALQSAALAAAGMAKMMAIGSAVGSGGAPSSSGGGLSPANSRALAGYAEGGTVIADKPTLAVFGEHGREMAEFTPLDRRGANVGKMYGDVGSPGGEVTGKAVISISLTEGLEAKIIDNTLGAAASLVLSAEG